LPKFITIIVLGSLIASCTSNPTTTVPTSPIEAVNTLNPTLTSPTKKDSTALRYIMGKFSPAEDEAFVTIPSDYADRTGMYMRKEAYTAYLNMYAAAKQAGINLQIRSATRNFDYQKGIWERKWTGETILSTGEDASKAYPDSKDRALKILNYSSMPGTSRHHWGTDIDLNNFNNEWFEQGEGLQLFEWLEAHAHEYGYCRPYTAKDTTRPDGYNEEKWHWSYTPISNELTSIAETYLHEKMISGFLGSEVAEELDVINKYVLGINHGCRH